MLLSGCGLQRTLYDEGTIVLYPKGGANIRLEEMARRLGCDCGVLLLGRNATYIVVKTQSVPANRNAEERSTYWLVTSAEGPGHRYQSWLLPTGVIAGRTYHLLQSLMQMTDEQSPAGCLAFRLVALRPKVPQTPRA